jgi:hypothetical protein
LVFASTPRPQGAFEVRQLAAVFENYPMYPFFKDSREGGSKLSPKDRY